MSVRGLEIKLVGDLSSLLSSPSWSKGRPWPLVRCRRDRSRRRIESLSSHSGASDRLQYLRNRIAVPYPVHRFPRFDFLLYVSQPNRHYGLVLFIWLWKVPQFSSSRGTIGKKRCLLFLPELVTYAGTNNWASSWTTVQRIHPIHNYDVSRCWSVGSVPQTTYCMGVVTL